MKFVIKVLREIKIQEDIQIISTNVLTGYIFRILCNKKLYKYRDFCYTEYWILLITNTDFFPLLELKRQYNHLDWRSIFRKWDLSPF